MESEARPASADELQFVMPESGGAWTKTAPPPGPLIEEFGTTVADGVPVGLILHVPSDRYAVVVQNGRVAYGFDGGEYELTSERAPLLKLRRSSYETKAAHFDAAIYLVLVGQIAPLAWESEVVGSPGGSEGLALGTVRGTVSAHIVEPLRLFQTLYGALAQAGGEQAEMRSFQLAQPGREGRRFATENVAGTGEAIVAGLVEDAVTRAAASLKLTPDRAWAERDLFAQSAGRASEMALREAGLALDSFTIESVSEAHPAPCSECGTDHAPTADAAFQYNASFLFVRFWARKPGRYCASCALKAGLGYTALTAVCGWWGLIGLFLTPVFIGMNLYNLGRVLRRRRLPLTKG
jgi:hypothetical protein